MDDNWSQRLKQVGGGASILYGFGYMAARARFNALGLWSSLPIIDSRYLAEGWVFLTTTLVTAARYAPYAVVLLGLAWLVKARLPRIAALLGRHSQRVLLCLQLGAVYVVARALSWFAPSVTGVHGMLLPDGSMAAGPDTHSTLVLIVLAIGLVWYWLIRVRRLPSDFAWVVAVVGAAFVFVVLPASYAVHRRSGPFLLADVRLAGGSEYKDVCLIDESAESFLMSDQLGSILVVQRRDVKLVRVHGDRCAAKSRSFDKPTDTLSAVPQHAGAALVCVP